MYLSKTGPEPVKAEIKSKKTIVPQPVCEEEMCWSDKLSLGLIYRFVTLTCFFMICVILIKLWFSKL